MYGTENCAGQASARLGDVNITTHIDRITNDLVMLNKMADETRGVLGMNLDRILGPVPGSDECCNGCPQSIGSIYALDAVRANLEQTLRDCAALASRLSSL